MQYALSEFLYLDILSDMQNAYLSSDDHCI